MRNTFTKGLVVGSVIGLSLSMMSKTDILKMRDRRRIMKKGRSLFMNSGNMIGDFLELFR